MSENNRRAARKALSEYIESDDVEIKEMHKGQQILPGSHEEKMVAKQFFENRTFENYINNEIQTEAAFHKAVEQTYKEITQELLLVKDTKERERQQEIVNEVYQEFSAKTNEEITAEQTTIEAEADKKKKDKKEEEDKKKKDEKKENQDGTPGVTTVVALSGPQDDDLSEHNKPTSSFKFDYPNYNYARYTNASTPPPVGRQGNTTTIDSGGIRISLTTEGLHHSVNIHNTKPNDPEACKRFDDAVKAANAYGQGNNGNYNLFTHNCIGGASAVINSLEGRVGQTNMPGLTSHKMNNIADQQVRNGVGLDQNSAPQRGFQQTGHAAATSLSNPPTLANSAAAQEQAASAQNTNDRSPMQPRMQPRPHNA